MKGTETTIISKRTTAKNVLGNTLQTAFAFLGALSIQDLFKLFMFEKNGDEKSTQKKIFLHSLYCAIVIIISISLAFVFQD